MPILEEEKKRFFNFIDSILKQGVISTELEDYKTDNGIKFPKEAYLYVPESGKPSTWKLRIWETPETKITVAQLGRAAAAFSAGGFRGQKVELPSEEVSTIKKKLVSLYKKEGIKKEEIPNHLFEEGGVGDMADEKKLEDLEKKLQELSDSFSNDKKVLEETHKSAIAAIEKKLSETHAKELEITNKKLEESEKKLSEREKDFKKEKVVKICDDLVSKGFWPAVVDKVKKVMLADVENSFSTIKLDEKDISISDVLVDMLEAIPSDIRVNLEEIAHSVKNTDPNKKYMSDKEVEEYAKDKKLSYEDACSELAREGRIEL